MHFLDRLERRFGAWAIPHFALFIVMANGLIYILALARPEFLSRLRLDPFAIRHGEVWRAVTFLFVPPMMHPFWMLFCLLLLYQFAQALEHEWGDFRFCLFYGISALAALAAALCVSGETLSNIPLNITLFLAFATLFPDFELLLFFILPVKVKWLAAVTWLWLVWAFGVGSSGMRAGIAASLVSYALFFGPQIWQNMRLKIEVYRNRRRFKR